MYLNLYIQNKKSKIYFEVYGDLWNERLREDNYMYGSQTDYLRSIIRGFAGNYDYDLEEMLDTDSTGINSINSIVIPFDIWYYRNL